ncbi:hypothetical protein DNTS_008156 [Danionella cerebrum]|uniref:Coiled-coil domain-containing protein 9 n=1 Tax=Danionella cerebrum TaxID=2873325 RepID=A0A553PUU4_9TELE|nr:hypothetical protein DNTS_008156 [Danionella translucida]
MSTVVDLKTKEEKDAELDKRIEALRKKNEALVKRYQEIQEDKKKAEQEGIAVTTARKPRPHEPEAGRRKTENESFSGMVDLSKPAAEKRVTNDRKPVGHHGDQAPEEEPARPHGESPSNRTGSGRLSRGGQRGGRREPRPSKGDPQLERQHQDEGGEGPPRPERFSRGGRRGTRGGGGGGTPGGPGSDRKSKEWEEKRRQNIEKMNEEMEKIAEYERGQRGDGEKNPMRNFLDDPRRSGPIGDTDRKEGSRRHVRNWGGVDFDNVKTGAEVEWTSRRPGGKGSMDMTLSMTGRERAEYLRWKKEREQIDEERLARHRNATGQWRREWDAQKTETMFKEDTAVAGEGTQEQSNRRAPRGRSAHVQQRSGTPGEDNKRPPKTPTFGDFLGQGKTKQGGPGRGKEEKGRKEEQEKKDEEKENENEDSTLKAPLPGKKTDEEDEDEWEDASDGEEEDVDEDEKADSKSKDKPLSSPALTTPSPKEQRTQRPKVHIPSPQETLRTPEGLKPPSPFSPLDSHQPVSDWGEEMEMLSPKSSLGESPLRPSSTLEDSPSSKMLQDFGSDAISRTLDPIEPSTSDRTNYSKVSSDQRQSEMDVEEKTIGDSTEEPSSG